MALSRTQLDKLGDRLRKADASSVEDVAHYDEYRSSHDPALAEVQTSVRQALGLESGGRLKTLESTVAKLRRQGIRMSQIADVAGCRLVVPNVGDQAAALDGLGLEFPGAQIKDYRIEPQHGYRAVHILAVASNALSVEIQVRTHAQDVWANLSEALAKQLDMRIKYGSGPEDVQSHLSALSSALALLDQTRPSIAGAHAELDRLREGVQDGDPAASQKRRQIAKLEARARELEGLATETLGRIDAATAIILTGASN